MEHSSQIRFDALDQLKNAQLMIQEGRKEFAAAIEKIGTAQELIDESADAIRGTSANPIHNPHSR